ncbi:hypothetical protein ABW20_dc0104957 [Dactylellina cionopaga]|nr:hypothetical protein ABW20_dc0104957 [Dactylellina cionopaga]
MEMATHKHSNSVLNIDDDIALHLLVETAIFDSSSFELLSHEEVDQLKREQSTIVRRIEALKRKLLLETKVRDAAQSLSRLHLPKPNDNAVSPSVGALGASSNKTSYDPTTLATVELGALVAKCNELDGAIRKLEADLWQLQRRLLCHTSRVLAAAYYTNKPRSQKSNNTTTSTPFQSTAGKSGKVIRPQLSDDFDDRSLYRPSNELNEFPTSQLASVNDLTKTHTPPAFQATNHPSSATSSPFPPHRKLSFVERKLTGLDIRVQGMLVEMGCAAPPNEISPNKISTTSAEEDAGSSRPSSPDSSLLALKRQIKNLEDGLTQIQAAISDQSTKKYNLATKTAPVIDGMPLAPIWDILHTYETSLQQQLSEEKNPQQFNPPSTRISANVDQKDWREGASATTNDGPLEGSAYDDSEPEELGESSITVSRSIGKLNDKIKALADRSLRLTKEKIQLRRQLFLQTQLETQRSEDAKANHEQQIFGLTNSLSNTLNELSQITSKQDLNTTHLKQEITKLQAELDAREKLHGLELETLRDDFNGQKVEFEQRFNAATQVAIDKEHHLQENFHSVEEKLLRTTRALEESLVSVNDTESRIKEQEECISSLRDEIDRSNNVVSHSDKQNIEDLTHKLHLREKRTVELEKELRETATSLETMTERYQEQSKSLNRHEATLAELETNIRAKDTQILDEAATLEEFKSQLEESKASEALYRSKGSRLEGEIQRLAKELETLTATLEASEISYQQQIEDTKKQAAVALQAEKGKTQSAMDTSLLLELEDLSKQNEELLTANVALQARLSETRGVRSTEGESDSRVLKENCERLQRELNDMLFDYESLMKASIDFEAERVRLEAQIDILQEKIEGLESSLADERIRWLGSGSPIKSIGVQANGTPTPISSGETMTMSVLRAEFKKMMRDMRSEHGKALRGEQEAKRRIENELRQVKKDYSQLQKNSG